MIIHFSTVHLRDDSRIRSKMVASLRRNYSENVYLYVQDGLGDEIDPEGFTIIDTGEALPRLMRMSLGALRMMRAVIKSNPKVAHFHDPELLPWAIFLRFWGIEVVYDVHEDYPEAVAQNFKLPILARKVLPSIVRIVEWICAKFVSAIVAVTPTIAEKFPRSKTVLVRNFPQIREFDNLNGCQMRDRQPQFAYIGTITLNRNIIGMLDAIELERNSGATLRVAGDFTVLEDQLISTSHPGWERVIFDGWVSRSEVAEILQSVRAGLVVIKPIPHEMMTYPIKLFEYMAAGVPVIASNFPLWKEIIVKAECGILVDPMDPVSISDAIRWVIQNPEEAQAMGERGRLAALQYYNWENEVCTLYDLYKKLGVN